jgi:microcystin-dependent protein
MATIDLGKIKLVWRGTYNNSTAYTVDDLVAYTDSGITSTYVCVVNSTGNAPSSSGTAHASWNFVAKGVADPIPSQSGHAGKFLKTDGSAISFASVEAFVSGMILIWSGAANAIPTGWVLCDGSNSTPNLAGKFVVGYESGNSEYAVNQTGGAETVTLSEANMPAHTHTATTKGTSGSHSWTQFGAGRNDWNYPGENTRGSATTASTGGGTAHENRPPYYALCYIMKS